jgi:hypothetical protein
MQHDPRPAHKSRPFLDFSVPIVFSALKIFVRLEKAFNTEATEKTYDARGLLCYLREAPEGRAAMPEKLVLVGVIPEIVVIGPADQVVWLSDTANLRIEFDPNRCPFQSNVFQAPMGRQLQSGPPRPGVNPGGYKYRLWMNDQPIGQGEVILREK